MYGEGHDVSTWLVMGAASRLAGIPHDITPRPSMALQSRGHIPATWLVPSLLPGSAGPAEALPVAFGQVNEARAVSLAAARAVGRSSVRAAMRLPAGTAQAGAEWG